MSLETTPPTPDNVPEVLSSSPAKPSPATNGEQALKSNPLRPPVSWDGEPAGPGQGTPLKPPRA